MIKWKIEAARDGFWISAWANQRDTLKFIGAIDYIESLDEDQGEIKKFSSGHVDKGDVVV